MLTQYLQSATVLMLPLIVAGILHMAVVKLDVLSYLKRPLHQSCFGSNKTWRGVVVMPIIAVPGVYLAQLVEKTWNLNFLQDFSCIWLGLTLGLGYVLAELPNSWIKRKKGIRPGEMSEHHPWLFSLLDQADSVFGCALVYALWGIGTWEMWFGLILLGTLVHLLINVFLWGIGLRKNPL